MSWRKEIAWCLGGLGGAILLMVAVDASPFLNKLLGWGFVLYMIWAVIYAVTHPGEFQD